MPPRAPLGGDSVPVAGTPEDRLATLEAILKTALDAIITINESGQILSANGAAERMFGYSLAEMQGQNVKMLMPSPYREAHDGYLRNYVETGEGKIIGMGREVVGLRKDGSTFPMNLGVSESSARGRRLFTGLVRDLTEPKLLEEQLVEAQKMEAVGQLAGGVAHDFNNLLGAIQGSAEILLRGTPEDDPLRRAVDRIHDAADRGARLTRQLLAFSRRGVTSTAVIDINTQIEAILDLLVRLIGEDVDIKVSADASQSTVEIDPTHLDQILMNLAINASDAMPRGGRLSILTRSVEISRDRAASLGVLAGHYVVLTVEDTGSGIDPADLTRLFDPFFTTKQGGRGTGLGLSTVHTVVKGNKGAVSVQSQRGEGTRFDVFLPFVPGSVAVAPVEDARVPTVASASILLVEDDASMRDLLRDVLEMEGHEVLAASSPDEALLMARSPSRIDLLVTDVVMPGMTGVDLAEQLRRRHSGLEVIFMSGYTDGTLSDRGILTPGANLMHKPFSIDALTVRVTEILGRDG